MKFVKENKWYTVFYLVWTFLQLILFLASSGYSRENKGFWPFNRKSDIDAYDFFELFVYLVLPILIFVIIKLVGEDIKKAFIKKNLNNLSSNPLTEKLSPKSERKEKPKKIVPETRTVMLKTNKGELEIITKLSCGYTEGDEAQLNRKPAPDGRYVTGWPSWLNYLVVENGKIKSL